MILTNGKIEHLVNWFEKSDYLYLCLLVAGHYNDADFFKQVFDQKETLHIISGEKIAIFLFFDGQDTSIQIRNPNNGMYGNVIPGKPIVSKIDSLENYDIREENNLKEKIIRRSLVISHEIQKYFNIPFESIPCIFLLDKSDTKSGCIIPTKGEINLNKFYNFLIDLNLEIQKFKNLKEIANKVDRYKERFNLEKKWKSFEVISSKNKAELTNNKSELFQRIKILKDKLVKLGLSETKSNFAINEKTTSNLWGLLDAPEIKNKFTPNELEILKDSLKDDSFRQIASKVIMYSRKNDYFENKQSKILNQLKDLQKKINRIPSYSVEEIKKELHQSSLELKELKGRVNKLEKKYKNKFWLDSKFRPIKSFILNFVSFSKNTKDVLSLQDAISKLIEK